MFIHRANIDNWSKVSYSDKTSNYTQTYEEDNDITYENDDTELIEPFSEDYIYIDLPPPTGDDDNMVPIYNNYDLNEQYLEPTFNSDVSQDLPRIRNKRWAGFPHIPDLFGHRLGGHDTHGAHGGHGSHGAHGSGNHIYVTD